MSDKSFGDHMNRGLVKNPLLSTAVTGLSIEDLTHNAVLLPVSRTAELFGRQEPEPAAPAHEAPSPSGDATINPAPPFNPIHPPTEQNAKKDDFDVNEYFARLQGTRYVSAPINSNIEGNTIDKEENLEEINLNEPIEDIQQASGITADIAQNFSQLPTVLPQVASAVFSSFSSMLNMKSREHAPEVKRETQDVPVVGVSEREVAPPPREPPVSGPGNFRLTTKKKYAQIPGLSSGESAQVPTYTPPTFNQPIFTPPHQESNNQNKDIVTNTPTIDVGQTNVNLNVFNNNVQSIPKETRANQSNIIQAPKREESNFIAVPQLPQESIPQAIIPPPPMFSNLAKRDSLPNVGKSVLPPSVARRIGSNKPTIRNQAPAFASVGNIFVPPPIDQSSMTTDAPQFVPSHTTSPTATSYIANYASELQSQPFCRQMPPAHSISSESTFQMGSSGTTQLETTSATISSFNAGNLPLPPKNAFSTPPAMTSHATSYSVTSSAESASISTPQQSIIPDIQATVVPPRNPMASKIPPTTNVPQFTNVPPVPTTFIPHSMKSDSRIAANVAPPTNVPLFTNVPTTSTSAPPPMFPVNPHVPPPTSMPLLANVPTTSTSSVTAPPQMQNPFSQDQPTPGFQPQGSAQMSSQNTTPAISDRPKHLSGGQLAQISEIPVAEPPKIPEPPKASGNTNFRMTKKRPQYYSGPIEGVGEISNNVKPTLTPVAPAAFQGAVFAPEASGNQVAVFTPGIVTDNVSTSPGAILNTVNITEHQKQFSMFTPIGIDVNTSASQFSSDSAGGTYNTSFDLSRQATDSFEPTEQESAIGILGSLKSKLSSIDINKLQNSVTTFFDPGYNVKTETAERNQPSYEQNQGIEIFVPNAQVHPQPYNFDAHQTSFTYGQGSIPNASDYYNQQVHNVYSNNSYYSEPTYGTQSYSHADIPMQQDYNPYPNVIDNPTPEVDTEHSQKSVVVPCEPTSSVDGKDYAIQNKTGNNTAVSETYGTVSVDSAEADDVVLPQDQLVNNVTHKEDNVTKGIQNLPITAEARATIFHNLTDEQIAVNCISSPFADQFGRFPEVLFRGTNFVNMQERTEKEEELAQQYKAQIDRLYSAQKSDGDSDGRASWNSKGEQVDDQATPERLIGLACDCEGGDPIQSGHSDLNTCESYGEANHPDQKEDNMTKGVQNLPITAEARATIFHNLTDEQIAVNCISSPFADQFGRFPEVLFRGTNFVNMQERTQKEEELAQQYKAQIDRLYSAQKSDGDSDGRASWNSKGEQVDDQATPERLIGLASDAEGGDPIQSGHSDLNTCESYGEANHPDQKEDNMTKGVQNLPITAEARATIFHNLTDEQIAVNCISSPFADQFGRFPEVLFRGTNFVNMQERTQKEEELAQQYKAQIDRLYSAQKSDGDSDGRASWNSKGEQVDDQATPERLIGLASDAEGGDPIQSGHSDLNTCESYGEANHPDQKEDNTTKGVQNLPITAEARATIFHNLTDEQIAVNCISSPFADQFGRFPEVLFRGTNFVNMQERTEKEEELAQQYKAQIDRLYSAQKSDGDSDGRASWNSKGEQVDDQATPERLIGLACDCEGGDPIQSGHSDLNTCESYGEANHPDQKEDNTTKGVQNLPITAEARATIFHNLTDEQIAVNCISSPFADQFGRFPEVLFRGTNFVNMQERTEKEEELAQQYKAQIDRLYSAQKSDGDSDGRASWNSNGEQVDDQSAAERLMGLASDSEDGDPIQSGHWDLNTCESYGEGNRPDQNDNDLTHLLIKNITAPIQLSNPVEVPLTETDLTAIDEFDIMNQCAEISLITDETIETLQIQSATELLNDNKDTNTETNYDWRTEAPLPLGQDLLDHDYSFKPNTNAIGFIGNNPLFFDNLSDYSSDIKAELTLSQDETPVVLQREISIPTAPPAEDSDGAKSDETGVLDVQSIEQDASKDFPVFEEYVIEPSEMDDEKTKNVFDEVKDVNDKSDEVKDTFTNRVDRFKQLEGSEEQTDSSGSNSITMMSSYFDTGNYAAEAHFKNALTSPTIARRPPGFEDYDLTSNDLNKHYEPIKVPDTSTQTQITTSISVVHTKTENHTSTVFSNMSAFANEPVRQQDTQPEAQLPDFASAFGAKLQLKDSSVPCAEKNTEAPTKDQLVDPQAKIEEKIQENKIVTLSDPINFFGSSSQEPGATESGNRLASYFSTPAKDDNTKSFFELSQGQDHYKQNDDKIKGNKTVIDTSQSQDSKENISNIPDDIYVANLDLMNDLTSCQNIEPSKDQTVRTVNYFTVEYDNNNLNFNKGEPSFNFKQPDTNENKNETEIEETTDDLTEIVNKCKYCRDMKAGPVLKISEVLDMRNVKFRQAMDAVETSGPTEVNVEAVREGERSVNVRVEGVASDGDNSEGVAMLTENRSINEYEPVKHHWFYRADCEDKSTWRGFSNSDSRAIENAFQSPTLSEGTLVPTDGGRYDVNVVGRLRIAVYWSDKPTNVRRCSWFYKGTTDARYVPYTEAVAEKLEVEYRHGVTTGEWHRRLMLPNNELVVMHGPAVMVHFLQGGTADAFSAPNLFTFGKRVYRNPPKFKVAPDLPTRVDHLLLLVHGAGEWKHQRDKIQSTMRPRVVRRGIDESEIEDTEPSSIDHLLLLCHGVGSACDMRFRAVEEVVDDFRATSLQLLQSHYRNSYDNGIVGRVEVLPISWHASLHSGPRGVDRRLARVTLASIPRLRSFTNDTVLDVLFYTSPHYCQMILDTVCGELNRIYSLFIARNPDFKGRVSLGGHSLGSVILYDLLCNQPIPRNPVKVRSDKTYISGTAANNPTMQYPTLCFEPLALYALGSPIAIFECIRGVESLGSDFYLPTCRNFFNIFHPYDPIAYRIEPLVNPQLQNVKPSLIPHHKGRKRMHLELKDTMARVGADLKQKLVESIKNTWTSMWSSAAPPDHQLEKVVEEEIEKEQLEEESSKEEPIQADMTPGDMLGRLNAGRRVDYVLQEAPFEMINEYLFAMSSHVCYWESEDVMLLILREIYDSMGVQPDVTVPQQSMTVQRTTVNERIVTNAADASTSREP